MHSLSMSCIKSLFHCYPYPIPSRKLYFASFTSRFETDPQISILRPYTEAEHGHRYNTTPPSSRMGRMAAKRLMPMRQAYALSSLPNSMIEYSPSCRRYTICKTLRRALRYSTKGLPEISSSIMASSLYIVLST